MQSNAESVLHSHPQQQNPVTQYWDFCKAEEFYAAAHYADTQDLGEEYVFWAAQDAYEHALEHTFYEEAAEIADEFAIGAGKKTWARIKHGLHATTVSLLGNRATATGVTAAGIGSANILGLDGEIDTLTEAALQLPPSFGLFIAGSLLTAWTTLGNCTLLDSTWTEYRTAKKKKENGTFNQESLETKFSSHGQVCGYCEEQGIYLAVKDDPEALDAFRQAQENASDNLLPNV